MNKYLFLAYVKSCNRVITVDKINFDNQTFRCNLFNIKSRGYWESNTFDLDDAVLLLNSGLQDKLGYDLFDGDIIYDYEKDTKFYLERDCQRWLLKDCNHQVKYNLSEQPVSALQLNVCRRVGNIYESPDLL